MTKAPETIWAAEMAVRLSEMQAERDAAIARAEKAEAACDEWAEVSQRNYQRAKAAEAALMPFAFVDSKTTQDAWDIRHGDRFRDWIDFDDIRAARVALNKTP